MTAIIRSIRFAIQRVVRGYDDRLFWDMSEYLDPMIVAFIKNLRENGCGYPHNLTQKKWNKVLDTILIGFVPEPEIGAGKKVWAKYMKSREKALVLLAFYWDNLWD